MSQAVSLCQLSIVFYQCGIIYKEAKNIFIYYICSIANITDVIYNIIIVKINTVSAIIQRNKSSLTITYYLLTKGIHYVEIHLYKLMFSTAET